MNVEIYKSDHEARLIRDCQRGERYAQREMYGLYARKMMGVCLRYVNSAFEAEDVLINGFMHVFEKIGQYKHEGSFEGWIRKVMVNEALIHLRKNKRIFLEVDIDSADYHPETSHASDTHLEADDLLNLIHRLPAGYKTVFNLYAIEGYSHQEIAQLLGISENTSKSQLSRARALLQRHLATAEKKTIVQPTVAYETK